MAMTNQDILFASLVGSKIIKLVPRFRALENYMEKHVLPTIPFSPLKNEVVIYEADFDEIEEGKGYLNLTQNKADKPTPEAEQFFPLKFSIDEGNTWFLLPYEPMINISGANEIIKRNVAKWHPDYSNDFYGTIKERWTRSDYEINITGFLMGEKMKGGVRDCFPMTDFWKLEEVLKNARVRVACPPLEMLGINYLAVEEFTFPFTKGENVQAYSIKCSSDTSYYLLIEEQDA